MEEIFKIGRHKIVQLLNSTEITVQRSSCVALGNLARNDANCIELVHNDNVMANLLSLFKIKDTLLQRYALGTLNNLSNAPDNKMFIVNTPGCVDMLIATLKCNTEGLRLLAADVIGTLTSQKRTDTNEKAASIFIEAGVLNVVANLIENEHPLVQNICLRLVLHAATTADNKSKIKESGLLEKVSKLITSTDEKVKKYAESILQKFD